MASVVQRSAIGLVLIAGIVGLLSLDAAMGHGYGVIALVVLLMAAGLREYAALASGTGRVTRAQTWGLVAAGVGYAALKGASYEGLDGAGVWLGAWSVAAVYAVGFGCLRGSPSVERFRGLQAWVFGYAYVALLGGFALDVRFMDPVWGTAGFFYVVAIAKGTDIFAFFGGKTFGKTKFVPSVSPGKTVAGFVGALVGGVVITWLFATYSSLGAVVPVRLAPGLGVLMALVVVSGDLIESFMKRSAEVKDSAKVLPGFGGVLDIVDSVLIAAPAVYYALSALRAYS